jgi:putative DNA primase/helicase
MRREYQPHPEEVAFFSTYAAEMREDFKDGLLKELTPYSQFVVWRYRLIDGTLKKPPYNPRTHYPASVDNPRTWGTLNQALGALATGYFHGIGFVLSEHDPFTGIDLDNCRLSNGYIYPEARAIIEQLNTYTEISPSEHGIRMFVEGETRGGKFGNFEMYSDRHYMTITTRHLDGTPTGVEYRQEELNEGYHQFAPSEPRRQSTGGQKNGGYNGEGLPLAAQTDTVLLKLLDGDASYYNGDESRRDIAAVKRLMDYTGGNREWTKEIFRSYPIGQRAKAREDTTEGRRGTSTYLDKTIDSVLRKRRNKPRKR